jgi:sugar phosphate isomerase/epimerase
MDVTRRAMLAACAGAVPALAGRWASAMAPDGDQGKALGVVIHSYSIRTMADRGKSGSDRFSDPLKFLEFCHERGASGIQVGLGALSGDEWFELLRKSEEYGMYVEANVTLPRNPIQKPQFEDQLISALRCRVVVLRAVMLGGRRYETFKTADAYRRFAADAEESLAIAWDVLKGGFFRLAIENHKDFRADDLIAILKRINSDRIGVCLDLGNNIALLEDPMETVEKLAPWAFSVHLKDMAVREYEQGFLLSEVPLGRGFLDLPRMVRTIRQARPDIHFNLEMITRDPLKVPCLTDGYWATFDDLSGRHLARTLAMVRAHAAKEPLPTVSDLPQEDRLKVEDDNVRRCIAYAREHLDL